MHDGRQAMTNSALVEVITFVASPINKAQTLDVLGRSVFPAAHWEDFLNQEYLAAHLRQFLYDWISYRSRFELLLDLLVHAKEHLPTFIMGKQYGDGLMDYMIKVCPSPRFMYRVLQEAKEGPGKRRIKDKDTWDAINDKLIEELKATVQTQETYIEVQRRNANYGRPKIEMRPPHIMQARHHRPEREGSEGNSRQGRGYGGFSDRSMSAVNKDCEAEDQGGYETAPEEQHEAADSSHEGEHECCPQGDEGEHKYLYGIPSVVHESKQVCYSFAMSGECVFEARGEACRFSHAGKDVERFQAVHLLGPDGREALDKFLQRNNKRPKPEMGKQRANSPSRSATSSRGVRHVSILQKRV